MMYKFLVLAVLFALPLEGQAQAKKAQLQWPKTFSGQPDFVFVREDVIKETISQAQADGAETPSIAMLDDLLEAKGAYTPLQLEGEVSEDAVEAPDISLLGAALPVSASALPEVKDDALLDVSEFKIVLENAVKTAVRKASIDMSQYDFRPQFARMTLQSVVTSPNQYAVINNRRYEVGDRLHITVPVYIHANAIKKALDAHLPPQSALTEERYAQYTTARDEVLKAFMTQQSEGKIKRTQRVPLNISRIESRKVILNVGGRNYDLAIKFRL